MKWERFKWLIILAFKWNKTAYPKTKWGVRLCLAAMASSFFSFGVVDIQFKNEFIVDTLNLTGQEPSLYSMYLSAFLALIGTALIYSEWNIKTRHTAKVLISALPGMSDVFPDNILDSTEKAFCREAVTLGKGQDIEENIELQIKRFNAELEINIFKRFILQEKGQRLYIGGLARIPFLVSYGTLLRNLSSELFYFDKFHHKGEWQLLSCENEKIEIIQKNEIDSVNENGDVGIVVNFTTEIKKHQLPSNVQEYVIEISPSIARERNLIKNQDNLQHISKNIGVIIDKLSALPKCKRVHLFLSVQSSLAIEIGRRYQEGTHKKWIIHNYDAESGRYHWALELSKFGVVTYEYLDISKTN
ncbi:MAG: SAVED domain-containing protein [Saccharospirillaceae bacterium]|nr:SAVED domain-containing protein [Pseudomonadales bacterium]NRB78844.1 SAVED domain-containing protein [Saccharospirillaceae bacterium]